MDNQQQFKATKLWNEAVDIFKKGVPLGDHKKNMKTYTDTFVAKDAAHWFHKQLKDNNCFGSDITFEQTCKLLNKFINNGIFKSVNLNSEDVVFKPNTDLYRLSEPREDNKKKIKMIPLDKSPVGSKRLNERLGKIKIEDLTKRNMCVDIGQVTKCVVIGRLEALYNFTPIEMIMKSHQSVSLISGNWCYLNLLNELPLDIDAKNSGFSKLEWIWPAMNTLMFWNRTVNPSYGHFAKDVVVQIAKELKSTLNPLIPEYIYQGVMNGMKANIIKMKLKDAKSWKYVSVNNSYSSKSTENLLLNIASPAKPNDYKLPPNTCFETTFSSESPTTRIIPQQKYKDSFSFDEDNIQEPKHRKYHSLSEIRLQPEESAGGYVNYGLCDSLPEDEDQLISAIASIKNLVSVSQRNSRKTSSPINDTMCTPCSFNSCSCSSIDLGLPSLDLSNYHDCYNCKQVQVEIFKLWTLCLCPNSRLKLHTLLMFMKRVAENDQLILDNTESNKKFVIDLFSKAIINSPFIPSTHIYDLIEFMMEYRRPIFTPPEDLFPEIKKYMNSFYNPAVEKAKQAPPTTPLSSLKTGGILREQNLNTKVTYCEQVSKQEFEKQKLRASEVALIELLNQIIHHPSMEIKDKQTKLHMFKSSYPHIYEKKFASAEEETRVLEEQQKQRQQQQHATGNKSRNIFSRFKSLRF